MVRWITNTTTTSKRSRRASPRTDDSCRATQARTWRPIRAAHPARVFRGHLSYESTQQAAQQSSCWARMLVREKCHVKRIGTSLFAARLLYGQSAQARMLESGAKRSALGASLRNARHSSSRPWLDFFVSTDITAASHEQTNKLPEYHPRRRVRARRLFRLARTRLVLRSDHTLKL